MSALLRPTLDDYLHSVFEADVRLRISERRLRRGEWRLWWRYLRQRRTEHIYATPGSRARVRTQAIYSLTALSMLTALGDAMEADLRFLRRVMAKPENRGFEVVELIYEPEPK